MNIYDFEVYDGKENDYALSQHAGRVTLIVNVASKCGHTPQYEELEALYKKYHDQGFDIIGFPCNQFMGQEPGSNEQIQEFCQLNYGVTFPIMAKVKVNGKDADPLYQFLTSADNAPFDGKIKWNFAKFLVNRDGKVIDRFDPKEKPLAFEDKIVAALAK